MVLGSSVIPKPSSIYLRIKAEVRLKAAVTSAIAGANASH